MIANEKEEHELNASIGAVVRVMRTHGVRRLLLEGVELELTDTIPAPPPEWEPAEQPEPKLPTQCIYPECADSNGNWSFDSRYCRKHGMQVSGVKT